MQSVSTDRYAGFAVECDDANSGLGVTQVGYPFDKLLDEFEHIVVIIRHGTRSINDHHDVTGTVQHCTQEWLVNGDVFKH